MSNEVNSHHWLSSSKTVEEHNNDIQDAVAGYRRRCPDANLIPLHKVYRAEDGSVQCTCGNKECMNKGKHPLRKGWRDGGYDIADFQPRDWKVDGKVVLKGVSPNVGLEPGSIGLVAIDRDSYKKDYAGNKLPLPENTLSQVSGGGGTHLLYKLPEGKKIGNRKGTLPRGLDIRSTAGIIVVDPSLHESGNHYRMSGPLDVDQVLDIPEWLLVELEKGSEKASSGQEDYTHDIDPEKLEKLLPEFYDKINNQKIRAKIFNGPSKKDDRSSIDMEVCCSMAAHNCSAEEIYSTFVHYPIGTKGKYAAEGDNYLRRTINNAFAYINRDSGSTSHKVDAPAKNETKADYIIRILKTCKLGEVFYVSSEDEADKTLYESLWYNLDEKRPYCGSDPLTDLHEELIFAKFETIDKSPPRTQIASRITEVSYRHRHSPLSDYFDSLIWDGTPRLREFAQTYLQDDDAIVEYDDGRVEFLRCIYFPKWMVGAVAKVYTEGKEQNAVLVLAGKQNIGKSTFARRLGEGIGRKFCTEGSLNPDKDEDKLRASTMLLWELSELGATTRRNDLEALKSFFTMEIFDLRLPWGKRGERFPHRASYIATVNDGAPFLNDPTGNRRYMVLNMESINWDYTSVDVNQLWAEAVYLYNNDFDYRLTAEEASIRDQQNELHNTPNIMDDYIAKYCFTGLPGHHFVPSSELTEAFFALPLCKGKTERQLQIDISTAMTKLGVKKCRGRIIVEDHEGREIEKQVQGYAGVKINTKALNSAINVEYLNDQEAQD